MKIPIYHIDAFADHPFKGNPAAICPLETWLPDAVMQSIAEENNLSETAYFVPTEKVFHIRWFTPVREVNLCGHATLAAAHVIFQHRGYEEETIVFESKSGALSVSRKDGELVMDCPAQPPSACDIPREIEKACGSVPVECLKSEDYSVVFENEQDVFEAHPDIEIVKHLDRRGVVITSKSRTYDFVARFFAPTYGINEDPVTGSAYTQLAPYWATPRGLSKRRAKQRSRRGGELSCEVVDNRVRIAGKAVTYMQGEIETYHFNADRQTRRCG